MVRVREIPRTAAFAWSPDATSPWIATGTKSGAVDVDFSNDTSLELWDLGLDNHQQGQELQPAVTLPTETGFHDIAWSSAQEGPKRGIIAGAFDNGSLGVWNADKVATSASDPSLLYSKVHTGAIKTLQFNPKIQNFLATGGAKGELFITDLNQANTPIRLGSTAARADDIDCLDWNKKVSNILVTGSSGGFVTVWDMKTRKESLTLNNYQRKPASAVAWDPEKPTRLITAVPLDQEPVILVWDLRNSNAPEKILRGHDSGVLSVSWCPQDNDLLLSCGKDNRTILWNPQSGQAYGDYPVVTNWTFQTRFNPYNPNLFATASFDGKLQVQSLQNTNPSSEQSDQSQTAGDEDFFSKAQVQPQGSSFTLPKAPKWLERPASVSFGFGGRIVSVKQAEPGKSRVSKVSISKFEVDSDVGSATETFEKAIQSGELTTLFEQRVAVARTEEEKANWKVIETLVSANPRKELVKYLGFDDKAVDASNGVDEVTSPAPTTETVNGSNKSHKRFQSIFASDADGDFLAELAATKGTKTNNPFQIYTGEESEADRAITRALILGQFDKALEISLKEDRIADSFMIAICGGEACIKKAQEAYLAKQGSGPNYLRLLASVVGKNLWDTVHNADLSNWKEVMATLCTFADEKEFPDLCEALGDRIEEQLDDLADVGRKDASFCFLAGSKLEKVVAIWIRELKEHEEAGATEGDASSAFSLHARGLQDLIEKVTIFRKVVSFQDTELSKTGDWKLEDLYSKYLEYADIVAGSGQLEAAKRYLDLLPQAYPGADIARSRVQQSSKKSVAPAAAPLASTIPVRHKQLPQAAPYQPPTSSFSAAPPQPAAPAYGGLAQPQQSTNPYAPPMSNQAPVNPYAPQGGYQPPQQMRAGPPPQFGPQATPIPPPPRFTQSPAIPPPSQNRNMTNWNDIPEGFVKPPTSRRSTPGVSSQPVNTPFNQVPQPGPPPPASSFGQPKPRTPLPPPPKAGAPPRVTSPLTGGQIQTERPPSAPNPYAPSPAQAPSPIVGQNVMSPPIARGASPFTAPPSHGPSAPNRYAPAPGTQTSTAPTGRPNIAPPPQQSFQAPPPPSNPYAPTQQPPQSRPSPYGPPSTSQVPQQVASPSLPTPTQQFTSGPPPVSGSAQPAPGRPGTAGSDTKKAAPPARKYPKGDRSHIPANAQPILDILSTEMARVKARAPASFKPQVVDTEKRLDILFDHLNNEDLLKPDTVSQIAELATALQNRDFQRASEIQMDVHTNKVDECGNWMVGVKRLIGMCKATP